MPKYVFALEKTTNLVISIDYVTKENKKSLDLICIECGQKLIPKLGDIVNHHFCHGTSEQKCYDNYIKSQGETHEHRYAKQQLCKFLNEKGTLMSILRCCGNKIIILNENQKAVTECTIKGGRADIAIIDVLLNEVVYVIEIKHTHATDTRDYEWFEYYSMDVIEQLKIKIANFIILHDIKNCSCALLKLMEEKKRMEQEAEKTHMEQEVEKTRLEQEARRIRLQEQTIIEEIKPKMRKIAKILGYLEIINEWTNPVNRMRILCLYNPVYIFGKKWSIIPTNRDDLLMNYFVSKQRCLRCLDFYLTEKNNPYCLFCYNNIVNIERNNRYKKHSLDIHKIVKIKSYFSWVGCITTTKNVEGICIECHKQVKYIWYYGYRSICIDCVTIIHQNEWSFGTYLTSTIADLDAIIKTYFVIPSVDEVSVSSTSTTQLVEIVPTIKDHEIKEALDLCAQYWGMRDSEEQNFPFSVIDVKGEIIYLKRLSSFCNVCNQEHKHELSSIMINGKYREIFFDCRGSINGKRKYMGALGDEKGFGRTVNIIPPDKVDTTDIEKILSLSKIYESNKYIESIRESMQAKRPSTIVTDLHDGIKMNQKNKELQAVTFKSEGYIQSIPDILQSKQSEILDFPKYCEIKPLTYLKLHGNLPTKLIFSSGIPDFSS